MSTPSPDFLDGLSAEDLHTLSARVRRRLERLGFRRQEPVAVVGIGCRFPGGADTPEAFWRLLRSGVDAVGGVPAERWDPQAWEAASGKPHPGGAGFLGDVSGFDPGFFGIAPREVTTMDPQHRLVLEVAWESLERCGYSVASLAGRRVGVFLGMTSNDWRIRSGQQPWFSDVYRLPGTGSCFAAGRISYVMGLSGPSVVVDTACSSSLSAVHLACQSLRAGDSEMVLAGGVNLMLHPDVTVMASNAGMLSPQSRCRTFDAAADGFVRGEGCGIVILKRLADAIDDGDEVLAVIAGNAMNQDGASSGLMVPNGMAQRAVIREALAAAGIEPGDVQYVEAHGTGTRLGDPIEVNALRDVLAPEGTREEPLLIGSVKTNIGHLEGAAGVAGLIKLVLAVHHGEIPRSLHFQEPNPLIPWSDMDVAVAAALTPWRPRGGRRVGGLSAFGASGTNVHVVVTSAPPGPRAGPGPRPERPWHLFTLSARTDAALGAYAARFAEHLESDAGALADVSRTVNVSRSDMKHRLAIPCVSRDELAVALRSVAEGGAAPGVVRGTVVGRGRPKAAMLFTGQGSQRVGMGRELYESEPVFRAVLDRCDQLLAPRLHGSLLLVLYPEDAVEGASVLDDTTYTQPALFAVEYALAELWRSWGIDPAVVAGHSIGEYVAACVAGVFDLEHGLSLVAERGRLMGSLPTGVGAMAVAFAEEARVRDALGGVRGAVSIAAVNGPRNVVVSGEAAAVRAVEERLQGDGVDVRRLRVSHAFHSPLMDPILEAFREVAGKVEYRPPRIRLVSNLTGEVWGRGEGPDADYWVRHLREPVRFEDGIRTLARQRCDLWIEAGPAPALLGMAGEILPGAEGVWVPSLTKGDGEWARLLRSLGTAWAAGATVDWGGFHRGWRSGRVHGLPTYPFQRERYWIDAPGAPGTEATPRKGDVPEVAEWLYDVVWERRDAHPRPQAGPGGGVWLVLSDRRGVGDELVRRLEDGGARCVQAFARARRAGDPTDGGGRVVDPLEAEAVLGLVRGAPEGLTGVVHLWSLDGTIDEDPGPEVLGEAMAAGCGSALYTLQALLEAGDAEPPTVWLVTRGGQAPAGERVDPAQAALWGLGRTAALEHPALRCVRVDLDPADTAAAAAEALWRELSADEREDDVALRGTVRWMARLGPATPGDGPVRLLPDATYLVTGGLGGIGLRVAAWMVERGARNLVLASRSGLGGDGAVDDRRTAVHALEEKGARILTPRADVSRPAEVEGLLAEIRSSMPPLRGVIHAAGVLDDGVLAQQTWPRFRTALAAKAIGAWNLHRATSGESLDFFVLFSSAAALVGSPGQANYAAANAFLGALAHRRRAEGLPALTVDWGPWADVGMVAALGVRERQRWTEQGVELMAPEEALTALGAAMAGSCAEVGVLPVRWPLFLGSFPTGAEPSLLRGVVSGAPEAAGGDGVERRRRDLVARIREAEGAEAAPLVRSYVHAEAARVLGLAEERLSPDDPLIDLGLDSLMAVQLRNRLQEDLEVAVPVGDLLGGHTLATLAGELLPALAGVGAGVASSPEALLSGLDRLSEEQVDALLDSMIGEGGVR